MKVQYISAFTQNGRGGNPAGVVIAPALPDDAAMQQIAARVGYSETVFAAPLAEQSPHRLRVRYFSPENEVPFCGHATIALGTALAEAYGAGEFTLLLNHATITVTGRQGRDGPIAELVSPRTHSTKATDNLVAQALVLFGYGADDLDDRIPPRLAHAGADHLLVALASRSRLADLQYELDRGRAFMRAHGLVTVAFVVAETDQLFHARNAFASGGVVEDPATGAAAAALAGALRDISWPHGGGITIHQGHDMGNPSEIFVTMTDEPGAPVHVRGRTAIIDTPKDFAGP
jgi:PhzF family phenazine biosynthesis protein